MLLIRGSVKALTYAVWLSLALLALIVIVDLVS